MSRFNVKKVAVLGAGVMGAQIAAHLVNVKVPVVLFDLPAKEGPKSGIAERAIANLKKLKPSPIGVAEDADLIQAANYEEHLKLLKECDDDRKDKPLLGLEIIRGAKKAEGKDVWEGGKILDPENGRNYTLRLTPTEGGKKLEVRGSIGPFGRTQTWQRVE